MTNSAFISPSPRALAGAVEKKYGSRLTSQESLVLHILLASDGLVTYEAIADHLWGEGRGPDWPTRLIHVVVCTLKKKVPVFKPKTVIAKGYECPLGFADVSTKAEDC